MRRNIFSKNINLKFLHRAFLTHALFFACLSSFETHAMEDRGACQDDESEETRRAQQMRSFLESQREDSGAAASASYTFSAPQQTFRDHRAEEKSRTFRTLPESFSLLDVGTQRSDPFHRVAAASLTNSFQNESLFSQGPQLNLFQSLQEETPFSFFRSPMAGGPPPRDPLRELERYRLRMDQLTEIRMSGNFVRGNIQSYLENLRPYWERNSSLFLRSLRLLNFQPPRLNLFDHSLTEILRPIFPSQFILLGEGLEPQGVDNEARRARAIEAARNLENVMNAERMIKTKRSMEIIYGLLRGKEIDEEVCILEFRLYLEHLQKGTRHASFARVNGMNEVDNAFFTLERSGHFRDYDSILLEDAQVYTNLDDGTPVTMKSLLAKTWWLINRQFKDGQQDLLKESLVRALGQSIEDDGHRVCNVGKSQRITTVLQGYIDGIKTDDINIAPEPDAFLSSFFASKQEEIMAVYEKTSEEKGRYAAQLLEEVKKMAEEVYKDTPEKIEEVLVKIKVFLRLSLEIEDIK